MTAITKTPEIVYKGTVIPFSSILQANTNRRRVKERKLLIRTTEIHVHNCLFDTIFLFLNISGLSAIMQQIAQHTPGIFNDA